MPHPARERRSSSAAPIPISPRAPSPLGLLLERLLHPATMPRRPSGRCDQERCRPPSSSAPSPAATSSMSPRASVPRDRPLLPWPRLAVRAAAPVGPAIAPPRRGHLVHPPRLGQPDPKLLLQPLLPSSAPTSPASSPIGQHRPAPPPTAATPASPAALLHAPLICLRSPARRQDRSSMSPWPPSSLSGTSSRPGTP